MKTNTLSLKNILSFCVALDAHMLNSKNFFDGAFLNLLEQYLGYTNSSFVLYEDNSNYVDSVGHNIPMDDYYDSFLDIDPLSSYITANYDIIMSSNNKVVKTSSVFDDYFHSRYHRELRTFSEIDYSAVILFDNVRLTVYKNAGEEDFTDEEITLLNELQQVITSKYLLFSKLIKQTLAPSLGELKKVFFDKSSTGVIIVDSSYKILDQNNASKKYLQALSPKQTAEDFFKSIFTLLDISDHSNKGAFFERTLKFVNYTITIRLYTKKSFVMPNSDIFFIIIEKNNNAESALIDDDPYHNATSSFQAKYALTSRELEIIEALSDGKTYAEISNSLYISINTTRTHVKNIYHKLGINNQRSLLYLYNNHILRGK